MKKVVPFTKTITFRTMIAEITDIEVNHTLALNENHEIEGDILVDGTYKMTDASQIEEEFHYKLPFTIEVDSKYDLKELEITIGDFYFEIINEEDLKINVEIEMDGLEEKMEELSPIITKVSLDNDTEVLEVEEPKEEEKELVRNKEVEESKDIPVPIEIEETTEKIEFQTESNPLDKLAEEIEADIKNDTGSEKIMMKQMNFQKNMQEKEQFTAESSNDSNLASSNVSSIFSSLTSGEETFSTYYVYMVREADTIESILEKYQTTREKLQDYNDLTDVKVGSKLIIPCVHHE